MIDRDQLREALAAWDEWSRLWCEDYEKTANREPPDFSLLVEAARLAADPDTLTIWWCEVHKSQTTNQKDCLLAPFKLARSSCRMVRMILVPGEKE